MFVFYTFTILVKNYLTRKNFSKKKSQMARLFSIKDEFLKNVVLNLTREIVTKFIPFFYSCLQYWPRDVR